MLGRRQHVIHLDILTHTFSFSLTLKFLLIFFIIIVCIYMAYTDSKKILNDNIILSTILL